MIVGNAQGYEVCEGAARAVCRVLETEEGRTVYVTDFVGDEEDREAAARVFFAGRAEARRRGAVRIVCHVPLAEAAEGKMGKFYEKAGFEPVYVTYLMELK